MQRTTTGPRQKAKTRLERFEMNGAKATLNKPVVMYAPTSVA